MQTLVDAVDAASHQGEHFCVVERVIISPSAGVFQPACAVGGVANAGQPVVVGTVMGHIAGHEVRSPFAGTLMGMLAVPGERVHTGQRIAWLRVSGGTA